MFKGSSCITIAQYVTNHISLAKKKRVLNEGGAADFKQKSLQQGVATHLVAAFEPQISSKLCS